MYHDFLSPPRRGSHVKSDHIHNHQTFSRESTSREVDSFLVGPFDSLSQPHHATHSVTYIPGLSSPSDVSISITASTVAHSHLDTVDHPNLGLPRTSHSLTSAINTLLAIRNSSILSTCPNHHNILCSALLANSLSIPALLRTSSFLTLSIRDTPTKLLKHFISRTFTFLLSALLISYVSSLYNAVGTITPSYRHFFCFIPNPLLLRTVSSNP